MSGSLIVFRGYQGVGKSFLIHSVVERAPECFLLSRDELRTAIIPRPGFGAAEKRLVDSMILRMADYLLSEGGRVIIDGMVLTSKSFLDALISTAEKTASPHYLIECYCRDQTALKRIRMSAEHHPARDRNENSYFRVKERYEPVDYPRLMVDTEDDIELNVGKIMEYIGT